MMTGIFSLKLELRFSSGRSLPSWFLMPLSIPISPRLKLDDVQANLTRFSLYFPEKRDFFLENDGVFSWGPKVERMRSPELLPFFSRRIGLTDDGELVPTLGGARLTGRAGKYSIGIMSMQTDDFWTNPEEDEDDEGF